MFVVENPPLGQVSPPPQFLSLMRRCWEQDAERRPAAAAVVAAIEAITEVRWHIRTVNTPLNHVSPTDVVVITLYCM